jgi:hypothetical protein
LYSINFLFVAKRYYLQSLEVIINNTTDINNLLVQATECKNLLAVKLILKNARVDVLYSYNLALQIAIDVDFSEAIQLLIQDFRFDNHRIPGNQYGDLPIICYCVMHGSTMALKLLLACPLFDPSDYYNRAVREAVRCDDTQRLQLLMADPRVDPSIPIDFDPDHNSFGRYPTIYRNQALRLAIKDSKLPFVKLLLSDPRVAQESPAWSLELAVYQNQMEIVDYLLADGKAVVSDILYEYAHNRRDARLIKAFTRK